MRRGQHQAEGPEGRATAPGRRLRAFLHCSQGGLSVEFALWIPFFMALLLFAIDASLAFARQSSFMSISRETARIVARHGLEPAEAEVYAAQRAAFNGHRPEVAVTLDDRNETVTVTIGARTREVAPFGALGIFAGERVLASVTQVMEPL